MFQWSGIFVRRFRFPRVVDRVLVPATAEPLISCVVRGTAEFQEREIGGDWLKRQLQRGDIFVTRSKTPYELRCKSPAGEELDFIVIHLAVDQYLAALETVYPGKADEVEVIDFFGRDEALAHVCFACAEMLVNRVPGESKRVAALAQFLVAYLVEKYTDAAEEISVEALAKLVEISPFHFSRVFKQTTGMSPMQFVTRERITRAQQLIRETSRSLIDIALEVGYTSPSHFAQVFGRVVGVTPSEFRNAL